MAGQVCVWVWQRLGKVCRKGTGEREDRWTEVTVLLRPAVPCTCWELISVL